jgi:AcrR family transcriptional regulator
MVEDAPSDRQAAFRRRVLDSFTTRAEQVGVRRVRMEDLAADLRVSKRTIYEAYPTKESLVRAFVDTWSARVQDQVAYRRASTDAPVDQLRRWARWWSAGNGRISELLWDDIKREYPEIYAEFRAARREQMKDSTDAMKAVMAPEVDPEVAIAIFGAIRRMAQDARLRQALGMEMEELLLKAVEIWARGAYREPYGRGAGEAANIRQR